METVAKKLSTGLAYLNAKNYTMAETVAKDILKTDPHYEAALKLHYDCHFNQRNYKEALVFAENWLAMNSQSALGMLSKICALLKLKKYKQAKQDIEVLKSTAPYQTEIIGIAEFLYHQQTGSIDKTETALSELKKVMPSSEIETVEAQIFYRKGHYLEAMKRYGERISEAKANYGDYRFYAFSAFRSARFRTARSAAKKALQLEPTAFSMRETIVASYLVFVPPFLISHLIVTVSKLAAEKIGGWGAIILATLAFTYLQVFEFVIGPYIPSNFAIYIHAMSVMYFIYLEFIYAKNLPSWMSAKKPLHLKDY